MPAHHEDDLPTLDLTDLASVTGGGADAMSSMLPMMMMMNRSRSQAPAPAPPAAAPWKPKILVDGVEQPVTASGNGTFTSST
jgi:hypothetical protein